MNRELNHADVIDFIEARNHHCLNRKKLEVDVDVYQSFLKNCGLSDEAKVEFLKSLWTVITAFIDLGYGVHPVQLGGAEVINLTAAQPHRPNHPKAIGEAKNV